MSDKLFFVAKPAVNPRVRVFCFPFAGGGINTYLPWKQQFSNDIELVLVQPPGRGSRILEDVHECMEDYIDELLIHQDYLTSVPYILFGHSLGARVVFELASQLSNKGLPAPISLVASGSRAPHMHSRKKPTFNLPDDAFIEEVVRLNGTPNEIIENDEIMSLLLPLLRADFKIAETYSAKKHSLPFPIIVFSGDNDPSINDEEVKGWRELSKYEVEINILEGDHFFINEHGSTLTGRIAQLTQSPEINAQF